jgi:hypothetical protein
MAPDPLPASAESGRAALWPAGAVFLAGAVLAAVIRLHDPWTARHPDAVEPLYVVAPAAHRAWVASALPPNTWARAMLMTGGGRIARLRLPFSRRPLWAASAPYAPADPPRVAVRIGADGAVSILASPHPGAAGLWLALRSPAPIAGVTFDGRAAGLTVSPGAWTRVRWSGSDPFTLGFRIADPRRVEIVAGELFDRWLGARPLPPVPPSDQLWDLAGSSLVIGRADAPAEPDRAGPVRPGV